MLETRLLEDFMQRFHGYGDPGADVWCIGMEEGGGDSEDGVRRRLEMWQEGGCKPLEDIAVYHRKIGSGQYFDTAKPPLQRTWAKLARTYLGFNNGPQTLDATRSFQRDILGRVPSSTCLVELMPLPSPSLRKWTYGEWSDLDYLQNRDRYLARILPKRIASIQALLSEHAPRCVVFYGSSYRSYWSEIAGVADPDVWRPLESVPKAVSTLSQNTTFVVMPHPVAHGTTNQHWAELGAWLRTGL